jgi:hypothetical protein
VIRLIAVCAETTRGQVTARPASAAIVICLRSIMRILAVEIRGEDSATGAKVLLNNPLRPGY